MLTWTRALVVLLVVACGGGAGHVASPKAAATLIDPGALPRQRLRYQPVPGGAEPVELSMKLRIGSTVTNTVLETEHRDVDLPTVKLIGHVEASGLNASGEATVTLHVEDFEVLDDAIDPNVQRKTAEQASTHKGSRTTWHMSPTGQSSDWTSDAGSVAGVKSELRDVLLDPFVIFPDEEVGIGGSWQVTSRHVTQGVRWDRKATYKVRDLTATLVTVDVEVAWQAPSQALRAEPNATTRLTGGTGVTTGSVTIPLHGLVPTGAVHGTTESKLLVTNRHLRISSTITSESIFSIGPPQRP